MPSASGRIAHISKWSSLIAVPAAVGVIVSLAVRPAVARAQTWWELRHQRDVLAENWTALTSSGSELGAADGEPVVEFSDYQCPYCRRADSLLEPLFAGRRLRVVYHHLPLSIHPAADGAARAALCAERQNRFRDMHHLLMSTTAWQEDGDWTGIAQQSRVPDIRAFALCLHDPATDRRLAVDGQFAAKLKVRGTPTFYRYSGPLRVESMLSTLR
jgi:hypothetical protein